MPELRCTAIGPYLAVPASALLTWRLAVTKPKLSARPICPLVPIANLTDRNETQYQLICHVPAEPQRQCAPGNTHYRHLGKCIGAHNSGSVWKTTPWLSVLCCAAAAGAVAVASSQLIFVPRYTFFGCVSESCARQKGFLGDMASEKAQWRLATLARQLLTGRHANASGCSSCSCQVMTVSRFILGCMPHSRVLCVGMLKLHARRVAEPGSISAN